MEAPKPRYSLGAQQELLELAHSLFALTAE